MVPVCGVLDTSLLVTGIFIAVKTTKTQFALLMPKFNSTLFTIFFVKISKFQLIDELISESKREINAIMQKITGPGLK